jgi:hypothetical protein
MRFARCAGSIALLLCLGAPSAGEAKNNWLGCWTRTYDADAKHQAQDVTAIDVSIVPRGPKTGTNEYRASVQVKLRDKPETYANVAAVHCRKTGARLHCLAQDESRENFWLRRSGADPQLQLTAAGEGIEVVPPSNPTGFVQILPQNPEYQLFVMQQTPSGSCAL